MPTIAGAPVRLGVIQEALMAGEARRWNHNLHYHRVVLQAVPAGCRRALDVGCGEGTLARELRRLVTQVTAIDLDQASIDIARGHARAGEISYVLGNFLTFPFEPASFDLVTSVASLHHMDATTALERMRDLLRPGGVLVVVGLASRRYPVDVAFDLAGVVAAGVHRLTKPYWEHPSPTVWPPPETYAHMRQLATRLLPGVHYHRHLLWRYSLVWTKPA